METTNILGYLTVAVPLIGVVGFVLSNVRVESKKREQICDRIDEVKEDTDKTFVRKDICHVIHEQVSNDLKEIKCDVKKLLTKNGLS